MSDDALREAVRKAADHIMGCVPFAKSSDTSWISGVILRHVEPVIEEIERAANLKWNA